MNLVEKVDSGNFNQGSAILEVKYCKPTEIIFQHLLFNERVDKIELKQLQNGYIIDNSTSVDTKEIIPIRGEVILSYEGVLEGEPFEINPCKRINGEFFESKICYKGQGC